MNLNATKTFLKNKRKQTGEEKEKLSIQDLRCYQKNCIMRIIGDHKRMLASVDDMMEHTV